MTTTRTADQLAYPMQVLLIDRETSRRYTADAIPALTEPDIERDIGACCYLGDHARPRYIVNGREDPNFDPTIPNDLFANGWYWRGSWLVNNRSGDPANIGIVVGMPRASLDEVWSQARKCDAASADIRAARAAEEQKKADRPGKKTQKKPTVPPKEIKAEAPAPAVVVVKNYQPAVEQLAIW